MAFSINLAHPTLSKHLATPLKSWLTFQFTSDLVWMNHFAAVTKKSPQGIGGYSFSFQLQSENLNSVFEQCPVVEQNDTNNLFGDLHQLETQGKLVSRNPSELRATSKKDQDSVMVPQLPPDCKVSSPLAVETCFMVMTCLCKWHRCYKNFPGSLPNELKLLLPSEMCLFPCRITNWTGQCIRDHQG